MPAGSPGRPAVIRFWLAAPTSRRGEGGKIMLIVHVHAHVRAEFIDAFKQATVENARNSVKEPGIARFDLIQQADDPARFILVEVYRTAQAPAQHKETSHYQTWRDTVAPMMAEPRTSVKYSNIFPADEGW
jgi:quinol monooxygenase YgiN